MSKKPSYSTGKRDDNEKLIMEVADRYHVPYIQLRPGDGADYILKASPMRFLEIKNPEQPLHKRALTECERELMEYCHRTGIPYDVVEQPEELADILAECLK